MRTIEEFRNATFRDPEGLFYIARQSAYLGEKTGALELLSRAIDRGFFCYPAMERDPWLDNLRGSREFNEQMRKAQELHHQALQAFLALGGEALLGAPAERA